MEDRVLLTPEALAQDPYTAYVRVERISSSRSLSEHTLLQCGIHKPVLHEDCIA